MNFNFLKEISVFIEKTGSIQDIIDEAKKEFKLSEEGSGILRFDHLAKIFKNLFYQKGYNGSEIYSRKTQAIFKIQSISNISFQNALFDYILVWI